MLIALNVWLVRHTDTESMFLRFKTGVAYA